MGENLENVQREFNLKLNRSNLNIFTLYFLEHVKHYLNYEEVVNSQKY